MAKKKKKQRNGLKSFAIVFSILMVLLGFTMFTTPGNKLLIGVLGNYIYNKVDLVETNETMETWQGMDDPILTGKLGKDVVNILLLGVEEIDGAKNTDAIIIATINKKDKSMKLTSLMRDLYVEIPGYKKNRINSVYSKGGIQLLYQTIYQNFGIPMDGYLKVGFDAFEQIVDIVGGVEVTLTKKEATYLNKTNYISNPAYRTVKEGTQLLNGNQALGYSRIRKVATSTESSDFGRTHRQRVVLESIFNTVKKKNILQVGLIANEVLNEVEIETDITKSQFVDIVTVGMKLDVKELEMKRIPEDGTFKNITIKIGKYDQAMLEPKDWLETRESIRDFLYGDLVKE